MNRMTWPSASATSFRTAFSRSSNSPRYFAPATSAPMSSATIFLFFSPSGTSCRDDALRQPFDDRGLADARLADQDRIVLGAARQHLDHAADLLVAADDRIELALARQLGQVAAVPLERLVGALGILDGDALRAADRRSAPAGSRPCVTPALLQDPRGRATRPPSAAIASSRCSVLTYSSFSRSASASAAVVTCRRRARQRGLRAAVRAAAASPSSARTAARDAAGSAFILRRISGTMPSCCSTSASSRCSGVDLRMSLAIGELLRARRSLPAPSRCTC